jgi:hypothetical protein
MPEMYAPPRHSNPVINSKQNTTKCHGIYTQIRKRCGKRMGDLHDFGFVLSFEIRRTQRKNFLRIFWEPAGFQTLT